MAPTGLGTALKPANEPIVIARKPLSEPTVAANVLRWGTGALNIDGCRVGDEGGGTHCSNRDENGKCKGHQNAGRSTSGETFHGPETSGGRWPANVMHDGSPDVLAEFPDTKSNSGNLTYKSGAQGVAFGKYSACATTGISDEGSAARFFYCAKASKSDRNEGCDAIMPVTTGDGRAVAADNAYQRGKTERSNSHPTVKPTNLMRWLCRLVTPPGGLVLDPFTGSGSTGKAALLEGFRFVGCEMTPEYAAIARARLTAASIAATMRTTRS